MWDQFLFWECVMMRFLSVRLIAAAILVLVTSFMTEAAQVTVTQVDKNADGTMTYHFSVKVDQSETMELGSGDAPAADFVTIYNFYGLVDGSVKTPGGWTFTSESSGKTPFMGGYPLVLPLDIPGTPNITWTVTAAVKPGTVVTGFSAVTRVDTMTDGMYSALVTQRSGPIQGASGSPGTGTMVSKQAQIGMITTPSFLADVKK
jgi:hypothetical protein